MKVLIYPHAHYRNRYIDDYKYVGDVYDETDAYSLTSVTFDGVTKLFKYLKKRDKESILEVHTSMGALFPLFFGMILGFKKRIYVCHGSLLYSRSKIHSVIGFFVETFNLGFSTKVVLISESLRKKYPLLKGKAFNKPGIFDYKLYDQFDFIEINNRIRIGYVGRDVVRKGIKKFADIAKCNTDEKMTFHVFGFHRNIESVTVHGYINDKNELFQKLDVLYVCSDFEGFCDAAAEAIMYGRYVLHDGVPGLEWLPEGAKVNAEGLTYNNIKKIILSLREEYKEIQHMIKNKNIDQCKMIINM